MQGQEARYRIIVSERRHPLSIFQSETVNLWSLEVERLKDRVGLTR